MTKLSIIIPIHNNWNFTKACLTDLSNLSSDHEVLIVDNDSVDKTKQEINDLISNIYTETSPQVNIIKNNKNLGFSGGCNKGYEVAKGENILFLNNDIRVKENISSWTDILLKEISDDLIVGPTGGLLDNEFNFIKETDKVFDSNNFYMSGWCLCAKKSTFNKLVLDSNKFSGPFSEEFGIAFFEDTDLSFRAKKLNINFKIVDIPVVHFGHMTAKKLGLNDLYKNARTIFLNKWLNVR